MQVDVFTRPAARLFVHCFEIQRWPCRRDAIVVPVAPRLVHRLATFRRARCRRQLLRLGVFGAHTRDPRLRRRRSLPYVALHACTCARRGPPHPQRSVHAARATLRVALSWLKREAKILTCGDWASGTTHFGFVPIVISGCPRCMTAAFRLVTCPRFGRAGGKWAFLGFFTRWLRDARRRRTRAGSTCAGRCGPRGPVMEQVDNHTLPHSAARGRRACSAFPLPAACKCHAACVHRAPSSKNEIPTRRSSPGHHARVPRPRRTSPARVSPARPRQLTVVNAVFRCRRES